MLKQLFFASQYLRLLERFEIALSIDNARFLIPCMLPIERPDIRNEMQHVITDEEIDNGRISNDRNSKYLTRNYHMNYIPAGFWSRLIGKIWIHGRVWRAKTWNVKYVWKSFHPFGLLLVSYVVSGSYVLCNFFCSCLGRLYYSINYWYKEKYRKK